MRDTRRMVIFGVCGAVVLALLVFGGVRAWKAFSDPYRGLTLTVDRSIDDATRQLLTGRVATTKASIAAKEQAGEEVTIDLYESLAYDSYILGDLVTARENYEHILNENPLYYVAWNSYANVLEAMGDVDRADHAYQQAIDAAPDVESYYIEYAHFLGARYTDRDDDERVVLEEGVKAIGQTTAFMNALAEWYLAHGDCDRAIAHYEVVRTLNPKTAESVDAKITAARASCTPTSGSK